MPVKIEKDTKIGSNNAIGDNASVNVSSVKKQKKKAWFARHPWFSAIICSLIAGIILLINWKDFVKWIIDLIQ